MSFPGPSLIAFYNGGTSGGGPQANLITTGVLQLYGPNSTIKGLVENNAGGILMQLDTSNMNIDVGGNIIPIGTTQTLGSNAYPFNGVYSTSYNSNAYNNLASTSSIAWSAGTSSWVVSSPITPLTTGAVSLGSSSYAWNNIYAGTLLSTTWSNAAASHNIAWSTSAILPSATNTIDLGASTNLFSNIYGTNVYAGTVISNTLLNTAASASIAWSNSLSEWLISAPLAPATNNTQTIGTSANLFSNVYATTLTSDTYKNAAATQSIAWSASNTAWTSSNNFIPLTNTTYNLGSAFYGWNQLYVGTVNSTAISNVGQISCVQQSTANNQTVLTALCQMTGTNVSGIYLNFASASAGQTGVNVYWNNSTAPSAGYTFNNNAYNGTTTGLLLACTSSAGNSAGSQITMQANNGSGTVLSGTIQYSAAAIPYFNFSNFIAINPGSTSLYCLSFTNASSSASAIAVNCVMGGSSASQIGVGVTVATNYNPTAAFNVSNTSYNGTVVGLLLGCTSAAGTSAQSQITMQANNGSGTIVTGTMIFGGVTTGVLPNLAINFPIYATVSEATQVGHQLKFTSSNANCIAMNIGAYGTGTNQIMYEAYWSPGSSTLAPFALFNADNVGYNGTVVGLNIGAPALSSAGSQINMNAYNTTSTSVTTCSLVYAAGTAPQLTINTSFAPATTSTYNLGSSSLLWNNVYTTNLNAGSINANTAYSSTIGVTSPFLSVAASKWVNQYYDGVNTRQTTFQNGSYGASYALSFQTTGSFGAAAYRFDNQVLPYADNSYSCGNGSQRWSVIYSATSTINTSDSRMKTNIVPSPLGLNFVNQLKPVSYIRKDAHNGRTHYGLLAQDVQATLTAMSLTPKDFAGYVYSKREDGATITLSDGTALDDYYGLRYEEFIAPLIMAVQQLSTQLTAAQAAITALKTAVGI